MQHRIFLHQHPKFSQLRDIVSQQLKIAPELIEKDYWIMHCLYGLQQMGWHFEMKGGTSLSKGYGILERFSEDIDIHIEPPSGMNVKTGRNHDDKNHIESRRLYYDWLAKEIKIDGIEAKRYPEFDDKKNYRNGGIRLTYETKIQSNNLKEGILLEVGFDTVAPNKPIDISSWAYDEAAGKVEIIDNRARSIACYCPGYTLVEKLQAISTKYRQQQEEGGFQKNFLRHYYDVYCLLSVIEVQQFIETDNYNRHKEKRFRSKDNKNITENPAFLLEDKKTRQLYERKYKETSALYYKTQPEFSQIMERIQGWAGRL